MILSFYGLRVMPPVKHVWTLGGLLDSKDGPRQSQGGSKTPFSHHVLMPFLDRFLIDFQCEIVPIFILASFFGYLGIILESFLNIVFMT